MKIMNWNSALIILGTGFLITSCCQTCGSPTQMAANTMQRQSVTPITHQTFAVKNPQNIALYNNQSSPPAAYRVIGVAKVSKRNLLGLARRDETIDNMMKKLAASIGGDGVIDIQKDNNEVQAKVIAYQQILI